MSSNHLALLVAFVLGCSSTSEGESLDASSDYAADIVEQSLDRHDIRPIGDVTYKCRIRPGVCCPVEVSWKRLSRVDCVSEKGIEYYILHDEQLDMDCTWNRASDGEERCMPSLWTYQRMYADSSCSVEFGVSYLDDHRYSSVMLGGTLYVYESPRQKETPDKYYPIITDGVPVCLWTPFPVLLDPRLGFFMLGPEVDPKIFVSIVE